MTRRSGSKFTVHVDPQPATTSFFKGTLWSSGISKREQDLGMMPPPESSMVPLATRRSSIGIPSTSEVHSPPLRTLKQEFIDESSQSSIIDPVDTHQERYRHISESSLDVHHGDSNISMINENSMDMMQHNAVMGHLNENSNLSIEDSVEMMVRRNSMSRSISSVCEHSVDINSNMSSVNEDSSCSTVMQNSSSVVTDRMVLSQPPIHQNVLTSGSSRELATGMVEKVMDLRMKMPIATVSDLANTSAPSIAALRRLGIMESTTSTLPAQSIQSVENYLTKIESKPHISMENIPNHSVLEPKMNVSEKLNQIMTTEQNTFCHQKILGPQAMLSQACGMLSSISQGLSNLGETSAVTDAAPVYLSSQRPFLSDTTQNETMNVVAKSEAAAIADQRLNEQTNVLSSSTTMTTLATALDNSVSTPINTEKLDAFVNSTVESHIGSPTRSESAPKDVLASKLQLVAATAAHPEIMLTSQDVMLNSSASLMVPPIINTTMASPSMAPEIGVAHTSPNISPDVILNSQISPSLMCRNTGSLPSETLLPTTNMPSQTLETALLSAPVAVPQQPLLVQSTTQTPSDAMQSLHSPIAVTLAAEPEKAVLLEAAVDFLQTQKKISELASVVNQGKSTESKEPVLNNMMNEIITMASSANSEVAPSQLQSGSGTNFIQPQFTTPSTTASNVMYPKAVTQETKQDFVIPLTVKEITTTAQSEKKNEDRMIPQAFTSLTENELINLINPSCFDQV